MGRTETAAGMADMRTIAMVLSPGVVDSQVLIDGFDITSCVRGVEIEAHVGEPLHVTLHLIGRVEVLMDVEEGQLNCIKWGDRVTGEDRAGDTTGATDTTGDGTGG